MKFQKCVIHRMLNIRKLWIISRSVKVNYWLHLFEAAQQHNIELHKKSGTKPVSPVHILRTTKMNEKHYWSYIHWNSVGAMLPFLWFVRHKGNSMSDRSSWKIGTQLQFVNVRESLRVLSKACKATQNVLKRFYAEYVISSS